MRLFGNRIEIDGSTIYNQRARAMRRRRFPHWNAESYEEAVLRQLHLISQWQTGQAVLQHLSRRVRIMPLRYSIHSERRNALTGTILPGGSSRDGTSSDSVAYNNNRNEPIWGRGKGSTVEILYTPAFFIPNHPLSGINHAFTDIVLLHELYHALEFNHGLIDRTTLERSLVSYGMVAEYRAILVNNIYASESGRPDYRLFHGERNHVEAFDKVNSPTEFYANTDNFLQLMDMCRVLPQFTMAISRIACRFNPIREYYRDLHGLQPNTLHPFRGHGRRSTRR